MPKSRGYAPICSYIESFDLQTPLTVEQWCRSFLAKNLRDAEGRQVGSIHDVLILEDSGKPKYVVVACRPKFWSTKLRQYYYPVVHLRGWDDEDVWVKDKREYIKVHIDFNPDYIHMREPCALLSLRELARHLLKHAGSRGGASTTEAEELTLTDETENPALWRAMYW